MSIKLRCLAVDDEPMALEKLKNYIERIPYLELAGLCEGPYDAMKILSSEKVDVMFIDINMPDVNGLDFVKALVDPPLVVFTTAYAEYAIDSYKVDAVDYLLKPFSFLDFQRAAGRVQKQYVLMHPDCSQEDQPSSVAECRDFIYLKVDYKYVRVEYKDIVYIEGMNEYVKVHMVADKPFLTHSTIRNIKDSLPDHFLQVHRSYVLNMDHVKEVERAVAVMSDGSRISVSDGFKDSFMQYLQEHSLRK